MKTKNYLLAVAIGLFTTYSCDNGTDLAEDSSNKAKDVILARYTSTSGDSGGIVYALTKSTNTRYTVGINLGRIEVNGTIYGGCIKAYMINQTFGLTRY